jgi:hypothetical protein
MISLAAAAGTQIGETGMVEGLVGLLIAMLIVGLIVALVVYLINMLPIDEPFKSWARIIIVAIGILIIIMRALPLLGVHV